MNFARGKIKERRLYLTAALDLFDRKVIGGSFRSEMTGHETAMLSWRMAFLNRPNKDELVFHSDRGIQYECKIFRNLLSNPLITQSMYGKINCSDNSVA